MNPFLLSIANPLIRSHVRAWLISAVTYLALYITACVVNQTPAVQHFVIGTLTFLQGFIPSLTGIVIKGQIDPARLAGVVWLLLSVTILPALLRIPWIQKNQLAAEILTNAEQVAEQAPVLTAAKPEAVLPMPAAAEAQRNVQEPLKQP